MVSEISVSQTVKEWVDLGFYIEIINAYMKELRKKVLNNKEFTPKNSDIVFRTKFNSLDWFEQTSMIYLNSLNYKSLPHKTPQVLFISSIQPLASAGHLG